VVLFDGNCSGECVDLCHLSNSPVFFARNAFFLSLHKCRVCFRRWVCACQLDLPTMHTNYPNSFVVSTAALRGGSHWFNCNKQRNDRGCPCRKQNVAHNIATRIPFLPGPCSITHTPFREQIVNVRASYTDELMAQSGPRGEFRCFPCFFRGIFGPQFLAFFHRSRRRNPPRSKG